jgi:hypothetical protein
MQSYTYPPAGWAGLFLAAALVLANTAARAQGDNLGNHSATQNLGLNDFDLRLRAGTDTALSTLLPPATWASAPIAPRPGWTCGAL